MVAAARRGSRGVAAAASWRPRGGCLAPLRFVSCLQVSRGSHIHEPFVLYIDKFPLPGVLEKLFYMVRSVVFVNFGLEAGLS